MLKEELGSALKQPLKPEIVKIGLNMVPNEIENASDVFINTAEFKENKTKKEMIKKPLKKGVSTNLVGTTKMKTPISKLFSITKEELENFKNKKTLEEKWSQKYKDSIDCKNPKGFSQKAHCQGKKKKVSEEKLKGGKADDKTFEDLVKRNLKNNKSYDEIESMLKKQLNKGMKVEMEHTNDKKKANEIAMDHLFEDPKYYDKLEKIESKESTGSGSAGGFVGPIGFNPQSKFVKKSFEETPKKVETKEQEDRTKKAQTNIDNVLNNLPKLKDLKQFGLKYSVKGLKNLLQKKLKPDGTFGDNKWNRDEMPFSPELDILNVIFQSRIAKYYFQEEAKKRNKFHYDVANLITKESLDNFPIPEPIFISVANILTKGDDDVTKVEATEATGSGSAGSYVTPAAWAKSTSKKDWRGKSKTQIPGGQFVQVKKKCKTFPYCNQGDIKALNLKEQKETVKRIITKVSQNYNISESLVVDILKKEIKKTNKQ